MFLTEIKKMSTIERLQVMEVFLLKEAVSDREIDWSSAKKNTSNKIP